MKAPMVAPTGGRKKKDEGISEILIAFLDGGLSALNSALMVWDEEEADWKDIDQIQTRI